MKEGITALNDIRVVETRVDCGGIKAMKKGKVVFETRADGSVRIVGYVNATERLSRPFTFQGKTVRERIKKGAFHEALKKVKEIKVNIDHDDTRVVARTGNGTADFYEDQIGLHVDITITDQKVIKAIMENGFQGWSFKFHSNVEKTFDNRGNIERDIYSMDLIDVSMIFDRTPAYPATSAYMYCPDGMARDVINHHRADKGNHVDKPIYQFKSRLNDVKRSEFKRRLSALK